MCTFLSCSGRALRSPRRNQNSSSATPRMNTRLVVISGKPALRSKRIWWPNTDRVPVPVRSDFGVPCSMTWRSRSSYGVATVMTTEGSRAGASRTAPRRGCVGPVRVEYWRHARRRRTLPASLRTELLVDGRWRPGCDRRHVRGARPGHRRGPHPRRRRDAGRRARRARRRAPGLAGLAGHPTAGAQRGAPQRSGSGSRPAPRSSPRSSRPRAASRWPRPVRRPRTARSSCGGSPSRRCGSPGPCAPRRPARTGRWCCAGAWARPCSSRRGTSRWRWRPARPPRRSPRAAPW